MKSHDNLNRQWGEETEGKLGGSDVCLHLQGEMRTLS